MELDKQVFSESQSNTGTIMIVDDNPNNLDLLKNMLADAGHTVRVAINGKMALSSIKMVLPDLILLDVQMPQPDGFEVCKQLKADKQTAEVPVIFISALNDLDNKIRGFQVGGVDYITKPFQLEEVTMRVNTHLTINNLRKKLEKQNEELIEAAKFREEVEQITRHNLKGPLTPIINFPRVIKKTEELSESNIKKLDTIENSGYRMLTLINRSLDLFRMENGIYDLVPVKVDVIRTINNILDEKQSILKKLNVSVVILLDGEPLTKSSTFTVQGEEFLCYTMLDNLILNAIEAGCADDKITISLEVQDLNVIHIHNSAVVPEKIRARFFQKFVTAGKANGTGLGTYSALLTARIQKGNITFTSSENKGTTISVYLPKSDAE